MQSSIIMKNHDHWWFIDAYFLQPNQFGIWYCRKIFRFLFVGMDFSSFFFFVHKNVDNGRSFRSTNDSSSSVLFSFVFFYLSKHHKASKHTKYVFIVRTKWKNVLWMLTYFFSDCIVSWLKKKNVQFHYNGNRLDFFQI